LQPPAIGLFIAFSPGKKSQAGAEQSGSFAVCGRDHEPTHIAGELESFQREVKTEIPQPY
jgi:hypothetical protein